MNIAIARKTVRDVMIPALGVSIAVFLMGFVTIVTFPAFESSLKDFEVPSGLKGFLGETPDIASPAGYLYSNFFSWIPLLTVTVAIIGGSWAFAGEQDAGTMDVLLAQPVTRTHLVLEKAFALAAAVAAVCLIAYPSFEIPNLWVDFGVSHGRLFASTLMMLPVSFFFLGLALWASAALPSRALAALAPSAVAIGAYMANLVGAAVGSLHFLQWLSPFFWSDASPILAGDVNWARIALSLVFPGVFVALGVLSFKRRDIAAGSREWSVTELLALGNSAGSSERAADPPKP